MILRLTALSLLLIASWDAYQIHQIKEAHQEVGLYLDIIQDQISDISADLNGNDDEENNNVQNSL